MRTFLIKHKEFIFVIAALVAIFGFILYKVLPTAIKWVDKTFFFSDRIYLTLTDSDKTIELVNGDKPIIFPRKIEKSKPIKFWFGLIQKNNPAPEITTIFVTLPDTAIVKSHPYKGWEWLETDKNKYFLDCPSDKPFAGDDTRWTFPILEVTFENPGRIPIEYVIIGNGMKNIRRVVTVYGDTDLVHTEEYKNYMQRRKKYAQAERLPDPVGIEVFARPKDGIIAINHKEGRMIHEADVVTKATHISESEYEEQVREISDNVVNGCTTTEEKILTLRRYVHNKMQFPEERKKPNGDPLVPEDIYPLSTIERLNSGLGGWCDQAAVVFIDLARKQGISTRYVELSNKERTSSPHTIAEALDGERWVVVDIDPSHDLELFNKEGKMASRSDIAEDMDILRNNPTVRKLAKEDPKHWGNDDYLSMFTNPPWRVREFKIEK